MVKTTPLLFKPRDQLGGRAEPTATCKGRERHTRGEERREGDRTRTATEHSAEYYKPKNIKRERQGAASMAATAQKEVLNGMKGS